MKQQISKNENILENWQNAIRQLSENKNYEHFAIGDFEDEHLFI